jgi:hypothetical protein
MGRSDRFYLFLLQGNYVRSITPYVRRRSAYLASKQAEVPEIGLGTAKAVSPARGQTPSIGAILDERPLTQRTGGGLAAVDGTVAQFDAAIVWPGGTAPPVGRTNCGRTSFGAGTRMRDRSRAAEIGAGEVRASRLPRTALRPTPGDARDRSIRPADDLAPEIAATSASRTWTLGSSRR